MSGSTTTDRTVGMEATDRRDGRNWGWIGLLGLLGLLGMRRRTDYYDRGTTTPVAR